MTTTRKPKPSSLRFEVLNGFIDFSMDGLPRAELATWLVLYRDAKPPRWEARTSVADIARRIGASKRAASTALASLQSRGLLTVIQRGGLRQGPSVYAVRPVPPR